jgi:hypothetical protein
MKCSFAEVFYNIKNVNSGLYLNVDGASTDNGANIQQSDYGGAASQWILKPVGMAGYTIENRYTGKVLNVDGNRVNDGANVQQWDNPGQPASQWTLHSTGVNAYLIKNVNSGLYLNVDGGSFDNMGNVQQWDFQGTASQWSFETTSESQVLAMSFSSQGAMIVTLVGLVAAVVTALLFQRARRSVAEPPMLLG